MSERLAQLRGVAQLLDEGRIQEAEALLRGPAPPSMPMAQGLFESVLQAPTFGFSDEMQAAAQAGVETFTKDKDFGPNYTAIQKDVGGRYNQWAKENPGLNLAGNLAGSYGVGSAVGGLFPKNASALKTAAIGIPMGGTMGALSGAGAAGPGKRTQGAVMGGAAGALLGGALPPLAAGGKRMFNFLRQRATGWKPVPRGMQKVLRAVEDDGFTPATAATRLDDMGPESLLADLGPNTRGMASVVSQVPGKQRANFESQLTERASTAMGRVLEPLRRTIGPDDGAYATQDALKDVYEKQAAPLYKAAYAQGVKNSAAMNKMLRDSPTLQSAWREVKGRRLADIKATTGRSPRVGTNAPTLEGWQMIKESLDDKITMLIAKKPKRAGELISLKNSMLAKLDAKNSTYKQARAVYRGAKEIEDAIEDGMKMLNQPPGEMRRALLKMNESERNAAALGFKQAIENKMGNQPLTSESGKMFFSPNMRRRLQLFMSDDDLKQFVKTLQNERDFSRTNAQLYGSQTMARQAGADDLMSGDFGSAAGDLVTGRPMAALAGAARTAAQKAFGGRSVNRELAGDVGQMLLQRDPAQQLQTFIQMQRQAAQGMSGRTAVPAGSIAAGLLNLGG